jgi:DNA-binding GntR family transcriptional regulator
MDRRTSGDQVASHIRRLIFEGKLRQGDHVRQDDIAAELGVSRIPVREAIIALDREGWVTIEPHRGAFVHGLDENSVRDHYEVLGVLYGLASRRATERGDDDALQLLRTISKEMSAASDVAVFGHANGDFWRQIFYMAQSPRLSSLSRVLTGIVPGNFFAAVPGTMQHQKKGVASLMRQLLARDGDAAEQECLRLLRGQGDLVLDLMRDRDLLGPVA